MMAESVKVFVVVTGVVMVMVVMVLALVVVKVVLVGGVMHLKFTLKLL